VSWKVRFPIGNSLWIYVPLTLAPGEVKTVRLSLGWHVPYSDTWAVSDEGATAAALIQTIEKQFARESPQRVNFPYTFESDTGEWWLT
jgi:hypothetical protein